MAKRRRTGGPVYGENRSAYIRITQRACMCIVCSETQGDKVRLVACCMLHVQAHGTLVWDACKHHVAGGLWQCNSSPGSSPRCGTLSLQCHFGMCRGRVGTASRVGERCVDCLDSRTQVPLSVRVSTSTSTVAACCMSMYEDRRAPDTTESQGGKDLATLRADEVLPGSMRTGHPGTRVEDQGRRMKGESSTEHRPFKATTVRVGVANPDAER
jgi:hypothetical protein